MAWRECSAFLAREKGGDSRDSSELLKQFVSLLASLTDTHKYRLQFGFIKFKGLSHAIHQLPILRCCSYPGTPLLVSPGDELATAIEAPLEFIVETKHPRGSSYL
jgi:hypothetical protein